LIILHTLSPSLSSTLSLHDALPISLLPDGSIRFTIRSRSSIEANSTVILPLFLPRSTLTRVSYRSDNRAAMSSSRGALALAFRRSEEHTSELQSRFDLVCRLLLEKK